jgi:WD40 repeat protein
MPLVALMLAIACARGAYSQGGPKIEIVPNVSHSSTISSVAISPDGTRLLSGSFDNTLKLWDAATGHLLRSFDGHSNWINSVAFSPDGMRVISGSGGEPGRTDNTLR